MTITKLSLATLIAGLLATTAVAQAVPFSEIDTDEDGVLSYSELTTTFGEDGAATVLENADTDADDSLTADELRGGGDSLREAGETDGFSDSDTDESTSTDTASDDEAAGDRPRPPRGGRGPRPEQNDSDTDTTTE
jgi:hypothetical protein